MDEDSIYHWDECVDKPRCFDFGDFLAVRDIEDGLDTDAGIIPHFRGNIRTRDHADINGIWAEIVRIMSGRSDDKDLQILDPSLRSSASLILS